MEESTTSSEPHVAAGRRDLTACVLLSVAWLAPVFLIGIDGEFPLNDDWAYYEVTRSFLEEGRFETPSWTYAPILTHTAIGALFGSLLGVSFESLRLVGIVAGWVGVLGSYALCRQVGAGSSASLLGAAVVGFNPIYVNLSYTFMTDIPFTALCVWSLVLLCRGAQRRSSAAIAGGIGIAVAATLSRQPGLALLGAFAVVMLAERPGPTLRWVVPVVAVGLLVASFFGGAGAVIRPGEGAFAGTLSNFIEGILEAPWGAEFIASNALMAFAYVGLFTAPVAAWILPSAAALDRRLVYGSGALAVLVIAAFAATGRWMPLGKNVIFDFGLGAPSLSGAMAMPGAPPWLWWGVTLTSVLSGCLVFAWLAAWVAGRGRDLRSSPAWLLLLVFPLVYLAPLVWTVNFFDRYLVPILPPIVALLLVIPPRSEASRGFAVSLLLLLVLGTYAVLGTRDYLEHHRARWILIGDLMDEGVRPSQIDGGFEFHGWFKSQPGGYLFRPEVTKEYVLTHLTVERTRRYRRVDEQAYQRWLPPRIESVGVFHRIEPLEPGEGGESEAETGPEDAEASDA